jgi:hypothetical protein
VSILITIQEEPSGAITVDYTTSGPERVIVIDWRDLEVTLFPDRLERITKQVSALPEQMPGRASTLERLAILAERCRLALERRTEDHGSDSSDVG